VAICHLDDAVLHANANGSESIVLRYTNLYSPATSIAPMGEIVAVMRERGLPTIGDGAKGVVIPPRARCRDSHVGSDHTRRSGHLQCLRRRADAGLQLAACTDTGGRRTASTALPGVVRPPAC